jgi:acyl-CoA reductase-like NAD-dependent aldehyde dehydrogenase
MQQQRREALLKVADLIEKHIPEMAKLESLQAGKAVTFASNFEMPAAVELFRCTFPVAPLTTDYAGWIDKVEGESFIDNVEGMIKVCRCISIFISDC